MRRKENNIRFSMRKQKSYLTAGVVALVAIVAMVGIYYKKNSDQQTEHQEAVIMAEGQWSGEEIKDNELRDSVDLSTDSGIEEGSGLDSVEVADADGLQQPMNDTMELQADLTEPGIHFSESDFLGWPIRGNVILNYSMDQSIYFATLDQYKYNSALVIEGAVNDQVLAAADGQVLSVEITEETGETISVDIGDGYQLVYGQLKDVQCSPGDYVEKGALVGYVSEPTKYYSVEGSNLYFQMLREGEPVNPMNYLE